MKRMIRRTLLVILPLVLLISLRGNVRADVIQGCTVTNVAYDSRLFITCSGFPFLGQPPGATCEAQTVDTLKMFLATFLTALMSDKLVNITYDPTCNNGITAVDLLK
jgi:hypothetical protein